MTIGKQVKTIILELLSDGKPHSMAEIRNYVTSNNITLDEPSTLVRNIMHHLKKEMHNLITPSRGIYQLLIEDFVSVDYYKELNDAIATIEKILQEYKHFNWYSCPDDELEVARTKVKTLLKLSNTITRELL